MNQRSLWTDDELSRLKSFYEQGLKYDEMVQHFPGRSKAALVLKI